MKKILLIVFLIAFFPFAVNSAQTTLDEAVDPTLDGNAGNTTGEDLRLTLFGNDAAQNLMNTELYTATADTLAKLPCAEGQVPMIAGGNWGCATPNTDTDTNAGTECTGATVYMNGEGQCIDLSAVYLTSETDDQNAAEVSVADAGGLTTQTTVEGYLAENRTAINLNTAKTSFPGFDTLLADYGFTDNSTTWDTALQPGDTLDDDDVAFDDANSDWTATTFGAALEEMVASINGGTPNSATAKVHWSQLAGVPADFADGTDDTGAGGSDATAIHDNVAGEISLITEKASPVSADLIIIEDSADSNNKKRVQVGNLPGGGGSSDAADINIADAGGLITGTNVETALQENRTAINLNTAKESNSSDAVLLARANHTGTQPASTISDFDTEVSNNASVVANTAKAGVTVEEQNVNADWNSSSGDSQILNKPTIPTVDDTAYNATSWDANTDAPTKDAVRDKFESLPTITGSSWNPATNELTIDIENGDSQTITIDEFTSVVLRDIGLTLAVPSDITIKGAAITAGGFTTSQEYEILTVGTTDFTLIGASANTVGVTFTATGAGSGTGTAYPLKPLVSNTIAYGDPDDNLIAPSMEQVGEVLATKSDTTHDHSGTYVPIGSDDDVPESGDFGNAAGLDADGGVSNDAVDSAQIVDGAVDFVHLAADAKFQSLAVADLSDSTTPSVLTTAETTNKAISNYKSTGADHVFTMPAAHAAGNVIFPIGDEFQVDIEPASGTNFYLNGTAMANDEHIQNTADTLGQRIVGYCVNINGTLTWMFYSSDTDFVEETP